MRVAWWSPVLKLIWTVHFESRTMTLTKAEMAEKLFDELGLNKREAKEVVESNNIDYVENRCTKMEYQKIFLKKSQVFPVLINR